MNTPGFQTHRMPRTPRAHWNGACLWRRSHLLWIKRVKSRSILNHKHRSVMLLRIHRSLQKLLFSVSFSKGGAARRFKISSTSSLCHQLFPPLHGGSGGSIVQSDLLPSCLLELIKRADCKQIFTALVWTYIRQHPIRPDKLTSPIHQQWWLKQGGRAGRRILFPPISWETAFEWFRIHFLVLALILEVFFFISLLESRALVLTLLMLNRNWKWHHLGHKGATESVGGWGRILTKNPVSDGMYSAPFSSGQLNGTTGFQSWCSEKEQSWKPDFQMYRLPCLSFPL